MTIDGVREKLEAIIKRASAKEILIALGGVVALIVGIAVPSLVGRVSCGMLFIGSCTYFFMVWKKGWRFMDKEEVYSQSPESNMKKLLFDDFQSVDGGRYVVKEVEEEMKVMPSSKQGHSVEVIGREEKVREFEVSDFFDLDSDIFRNDAEPRSEFNFLLNKLLLAMKEVLFAHSVAFFWANREKQQMVLEAKATENQEFMTDKRFAIENDVVSQVARNGKPQVLGRINPVAEKELIRYYQSTEYVKSCIVVPVYYLSGDKEQLPVGIIAADSKAEDAFGPETLSLMGQFTKLVSALIKSYTDKYDLLLDSELLSSLRRMQDRVKSDPTEYTVLTALADEASRLVNWDCLAITMYSEDHNGWILQKVVNKSGLAYLEPDKIIDFGGSIVGRVINSSVLEHVTDLGLEHQVRFCASEQIAMEGSFLCIPISSINRCYGALSLESKNKLNFSGNEVETIYRLVESAAAVLEVIYMNDLVKDFVIVDQLTGSFTKKHFMKKLEEEVQRADDFGTELALVSIAVDTMHDHIARYGKEGFDAMLNHVAKIVRTNVRPYDVIGRQDVDRIGILLMNTTANDGYLWAEKVRKQIASHIITLSGRSFSVTVSAGVCGLTDGMQKEELLAGTSQVLGKAIEGGGNLVRVF